MINNVFNQSAASYTDQPSEDNAQKERTFKENLKLLFVNYPGETANLKPEEMLNFMFENWEQGKNDLEKFCSVLEDFSKAYPFFELSPLDIIRTKIAQDQQYHLDNSSIKVMLKKYGLGKNVEKFKALCDWAYRVEHPYIYLEAKTAIRSRDYVLIFLWVNLNPQNRIQNIAQNIFKDGLNLYENADCINNIETLSALEAQEQSLQGDGLKTWKQIKESFSYRIAKWADANPGTEIDVYLDTSLVTQQALQKTFEMMRSISLSRRVDIKLKDIRCLPNIDGEIGCSLHPGTPLYFRVDLMKTLITDYMLNSSNEKARYFIISDIDIAPMTSHQLFDQRTLNHLSSSGFVYHKTNGSFENSFFIFDKMKKDLQEIHHRSMIEGIANYIKKLRREGFLRGIDSQFVYNHYDRFLTLMKVVHGMKSNGKVVKSPASQFRTDTRFSSDDYRREIAFFIGDDNIPFTNFGRNDGHLGTHIEELKNWKAEPLQIPVVQESFVANSSILSVIQKYIPGFLY